MFILLLIVSVLVGTLIGTVGVGGILLIPALDSLTDLNTHMSMATSLFSFIFTGILGTWLYHRQGSINWRITIPVCIGSFIAGYFGALVNAYTSTYLLNLLLSAVIIFAGIYALFPAKARKTPNEYPFYILFMIGAAVGFGSGLTGVGGPVLSVPLMVIIGFAPLTAIATSQVIQITAALSGSMGNFLQGFINFEIAIWITIAELVGVIGGAYLAHSIPSGVLKKIVSVVCIIVGGIILFRTLFVA